MRIVPRLALATCVALNLCAVPSTSAQVSPAIRPFRPALSVNEDPAACAPFLKAWTDTFDSETQLEERHAKLAPAFPNADATIFPPDGGHFYEHAYEMRIDFDGDGENEVLHFDPNDWSWRYTGPSIWLFESESDFARALQSERHKGAFGLRLSWNKDERIPGASYRELINLGPISSASIVRIGQRIYVNTIAQPPTEDKPGSIDLVHLNAPSEPRVVCTINLLPARSSLAEFRDRSQLFAGLSDVYGVATARCRGSLGWTAPPKDSALSTVLYRPWAMRSESVWAPPSGGDREVRKDDAMRELRYISWASSDPQSWRDYLDVKQGRPKFLADLSAYYRQAFGKSEAEAMRWAEDAWRAMLDRIMYARNNDQPLAAVLAGAASDLKITADTPPEEIARLASDAIQKLPQPPAYRNRYEDPAWDSAVQVAIHTRQPISAVRKLLDARAKAVSRPERGTPSSYDGERNMRALSSFLLASLGHNGLSYLILDEAGADPSASTNDFGKTALMYAAQLDQLNAVQLLISRGANVNAVTQATGCEELNRDHRTALMYAAENASPPVIDAIVAAGADITARDTRGNSAVWYFGRNTKVTDTAVRARAIKLLGG